MYTSIILVLAVTQAKLSVADPYRDVFPTQPRFSKLQVQRLKYPDASKRATWKFESPDSKAIVMLSLIREDTSEIALKAFDPAANSQTGDILSRSFTGRKIAKHVWSSGISPDGSSRGAASMWIISGRYQLHAQAWKIRSASGGAKFQVISRSDIEFIEDAAIEILRRLPMSTPGQSGKRP